VLKKKKEACSTIYIYIKKKNISIHALKPKHASLLQATLQTIDTTRDKKKNRKRRRNGKAKERKKKKQRI
jgi:hypothetical protein